MSEKQFQILKFYQPIESLKEEAQKRLDAILYTKVTVENIETFASTALESTVTLIKDLLHEYQNNLNLKGDLNLDKQQQEDEVCKKLGLINIGEILERIQSAQDRVGAIKAYLEGTKQQSEDVLTPPDQHRVTSIPNEGVNTFEKKKFIPRLLTLLYILETDFDIKKEEVDITEGKVTPDMMRQTPYVRVQVADMARIIYICDEEGNASYIFDMDKLEEAGVVIENLDVSGKQILHDLIAKHPGIGARIIQTKNWRINMHELLANPIPEIIREEGFTETKEPKRPISEFEKKEKKEFLPFEEFRVEVKALYHGEVDIGEWYKRERVNHKNWPSAPYKKYKSDGWIGWPELVGKESRYRKEKLSFEDFQVSVRSLYPGVGEIQAWYRSERLNYPEWSSIPHKIYKGKGWIGWPELVGAEKRYGKSPSFSDFQAEVKALYPGEIGVIKWYLTEMEKHPHWPFNPNRTYRGKGWVGWPELVEIENVKKKEFLSFPDFQAEVVAAYAGEDNIQEWYLAEKLTHPKWPSHPDRFYENKGWQGWPELVGRENPLKKEFFNFEDFINEVRAFYPGQGGVQKWYHIERKKHQNWPSHPHVVYKNKGWIGWDKIV